MLYAWGNTLAKNGRRGTSGGRERRERDGDRENSAIRDLKGKVTVREKWWARAAPQPPAPKDSSVMESPNSTNFGRISPLEEASKLVPLPRRDIRSPWCPRLWPV